MHNELDAWRYLGSSLDSRAIYLQELDPPTWIVMSDASGTDMGGVCRDPEGQYFILRSPFYTTTQAQLVYSFNSKGDVTINDLDLGAILMQLLLFAPRMAQIRTYVNNTAEQGWANWVSVSTASSVGPILYELALATRGQHIHASIWHVPGEENKMADTASWLTPLPDRIFLS